MVTVLRILLKYFQDTVRNSIEPCTQCIVLATRGKMSGEYIAQCARNECGYFGE